ncbi:SPOR domain-containing protein [Sphingomonas sp. Leaf4]|uniref:SPOR domain-containing protein n=1 Tax=Sphingomonas sp. Leaf4 TaxID=2876553 RepID=UPI001E3FC111|nr:SPOR domain-containing protein [Sphingomonas sp. Leaf4]
MTRFTPLRVTAFLLAAASPLPAVAQGGPLVQPLTPNADRLSDVMRTLGRSPNDLSALVEAGRLSGKLGDFDAAMQLLARAERVSPTDPRIPAARAATLVNMERPGQALALFTTAERAGLPMADYAADRGLAYDLLGYPSNAQRDYRLALAQGADDEVTRRLALSMGIEGDVAGATVLLDPLLRRNDRAAWRVRACVLAMAGDAAGADRIAASMLPGFGPSLAPFFRRLPQLSAADRAFAVHFGRLAPTPDRVADARLAPQVIPVPRAAPVAVAAASAPTTTTSARRAPTFAERRAEQRRQVEVARQAQLAEAKRVADARAAQLAKAQADELARRTALAQVQAAEAQRLRDAQQLAAQQAEQARLAEATRIEGERVAARQAEERRIAAAALAERDRLAAATAPVAAPTQVAAATVPPPEPVAAAPIAEPTAAAPPPAPGFSADTAVPAASGGAATVAARATTNDDVLARIIRNLDVPAAELGVAPPTPAPAILDAAAQAADAKAARDAAAAREAVDRAAEARTAKVAADKKAADAKKAADVKKAADAKRLADAKKAEEAAEAKRAAALLKADPERHWVQIAGGANIAGLPAAWRLLSAKAPPLKGRQAWTTPLRFTNRLLTGPFKTDSEAQAFVNTLGKAGLPAFAFTSPAGQKVVKVPTS